MFQSGRMQKVKILEPDLSKSEHFYGQIVNACEQQIT